MGFRNRLSRALRVPLPEPEYTQYTDRTWFKECMKHLDPDAEWDRGTLRELIAAHLQDGLKSGRVTQQMVDRVLDTNMSIPDYLSWLTHSLDNEYKFTPAL